jgi:type I restriction enzyme, S subunit
VGGAAGWREVRVGELGRVVTGLTPRADWGEAWGDEVDFITPGDQHAGLRCAFPARRLSASGARRLSSRLLPPGATCVTCIGQTIGKTSLTRRPAVTNQQINSVIPDPQRADASFLYYLLTACGPRIAQAASGSAAWIVNKRQFSMLPVRLPPLADQARLAAILGELDDKIAVNSRASATALALGHALLDKALLDGPAPGLPCRLGDLADLRYGKALPVGRRRPGEVLVYGSSGAVGTHDQALVQGPGIIIGRKGTAGSVRWAQRNFFPIDTVFYVGRADTQVPLEFLCFALGRSRLADMGSDSAVPGLTRAGAAAARLPLLPLPAMRDFQHAVRPLLAMRASLEAQSARLARLRDALLPPLVLAGRLPHEWDVEVSRPLVLPLDQRGLH